MRWLCDLTRFFSHLLRDQVCLLRAPSAPVVDSLATVYAEHLAPLLETKLALLRKLKLPLVSRRRFEFSHTLGFADLVLTLSSDVCSTGYAGAAPAGAASAGRRRRQVSRLALLCVHAWRRAVG
jgi:hypothetical protein